MVTCPGARPCRQPYNIDFLTLISDLTRELDCPIIITWVKGHQDTSPSSDPLSRDVINNIAVNALATMHHTQRCLSPHTHIPHTPMMRVSVSVNGEHLTGHFHSMLSFHVMVITSVTICNIVLHGLTPHVRASIITFSASTFGQSIRTNK